MDHPAFYIIATIVTILILYALVSLAYMSRRKKLYLEMQDSLSVGDDVLVGNAIFGTVVQLGKTTAQVKIADQVVITADRAAVFARATEPNQKKKKEGQ